MPNDAKLGLVVGVGLVIAVAVVFFRRDLATVTPSADRAAAAVSRPVPSPKAELPPQSPAPPAHGLPGAPDANRLAFDAATDVP